MLRKRLGSSPRVWGQGLTPHTLGSVVPIIPTRVGTRLLLSFLSSSGTYHPHACGDKYFNLSIIVNPPVSSPRVWGQDQTPEYCKNAPSIIPTRVGTRPVGSRFSIVFRDHPHACGDKLYHRIFDLSRGGSVDYNIKCNTKKYGHHTHFRVKCNYHKTKGTEVEYEVLYTFYTI